MEGNNSVWLIDPGDSYELLNWINENRKVLSGILLTHGHFDHIYGINDILNKFPQCMIYTNDYGKRMLQDEKLNMSKYHETPYTVNNDSNIIVVEDGADINLSFNLTATPLFTPGHNPSCITWIIDDCIFTGDSYIPGIKTVTKLPAANKEQAKNSETKIKSLAVGKIIRAGHFVEIS